MRRWTRELADRDIRGSVVAVPVLNGPAFRGRSPFVTPGDGKNLNRCFPGDPAGTVFGARSWCPLFVTSSPAVAANGLLLGLGAS